MVTGQQIDSRTSARIGTRGIRGLAFFSGLSEDEIEDLLRVGELRHYYDGEEIRTEGEWRKEIVILLRGQAKVVRNDAGNGVRSLGLISPGKVIGFVSLYLAEPSSAAVVSTGVSLGLVIRLEALEALAVKRPELGVKVFGRLLRAAGECVRMLNDHLRAIGELYIKRRRSSRECPVFQTCLLVPGKPLG